MVRKSKTPGILEVARAAGVSTATASRVLSKVGYPVSAETRARVEAAAQSLGFVRNAIARGLSRSRSDSIGVIVPALHAYYASMIDGIEKSAAAHGLTVLLGLSRGDEDHRERLVTAFLERRVDGLIVCAGSDDRTPGRPPDQMPVPLVMVGQQANPGYPDVVTDNVAAGAAAAAHLWHLGHRSFVYLAPDDSWHDFRDRQSGVEAFLTQTAEPFELTVLTRVFGEGDAYASVTQAFRDGLAATAVIAPTDRHALGAMAALADLDRTVPDDVAIVGFDNYLSSQYLRPALTSVDIPSSRMGDLAVAKLVALIHGAKVDDRTEVQAALVARQSSGTSR